MDENLFLTNIHGFGKEPHFFGTALMPCLCWHQTDMCFIIKKKMEHREDK